MILSELYVITALLITMDHMPPCHTLCLATQMGILHYRCFVPGKGSSGSKSSTSMQTAWNAEYIPSKSVTEFFVTGLLHGFKISFNNPPSQLHSVRKNLLGALQHPKVVDDYLKVEIAEHCVIGPFSRENIPVFHTSRFGVKASYTQQVETNFWLISSSK